MSNIQLGAILPNFNRALDICKGNGSETDLAATLGCTARSIYKWRRGMLPAAILQLMRCPDTLVALASDAPLHDTTNSST
jgi:hypothetical protein